MDETVMQNITNGKIFIIQPNQKYVNNLQAKGIDFQKYKASGPNAVFDIEALKIHHTLNVVRPEISGNIGGDDIYNSDKDFVSGAEPTAASVIESMPRDRKQCYLMPKHCLLKHVQCLRRDCKHFCVEGP